MVSTLPVGTLNLLQSDDWKGGPLLMLPDSKGVRTPTCKEISKNFHFIKAVIQCVPRKVGKSPK